jgi:hypothetical protein
MQPGNQTDKTGVSAPPGRIAMALGETESNRRTNLGLGVALIAGLLVIWLRTDNYVTGVMWAGACLGIGGLLGFLFGVPRTQARVIVERANVAAIGNVDVAAGAGVDSASHPNTSTAGRTPSGGAHAGSKASHEPDTSTITGRESNLEQISDWVTKLLVGGGLTQLQDIPGKFWEWGGSLAAGLIGAGNAGQPAMLEARVFATGLIIYFLILGFFGGYLITILQLRPQLRAAE